MVNGGWKHYPSTIAEGKLLIYLKIIAQYLLASHAGNYPTKQHETRGQHWVQTIVKTPHERHNNVRAKQRAWRAWHAWGQLNLLFDTCTMDNDPLAGIRPIALLSWYFAPSRKSAKQIADSREHTTRLCGTWRRA